MDSLIERVVRDGGDPFDYARIAEVLRVPTGYYNAYLIDWGAIEVHAQPLAPPPTPPATGDDVPHTN